MVEIVDLADSAWAEARWLILAPHPDDETLGAGALISNAAAAGQLAAVVFLTDGSGSHPHADEASRQRLIATRRAEARLALERLCGDRVPQIVFLDWPDANPHPDGSVAALATAARLADLCLDQAVTAIAVTALHEPHCDHAAAARLARAVVAWTGPGVPVFEYLVWADQAPAGARRAVRTRPMSTGVRMQALDAHKSQLTDVLGPGFRLDPARRDMPAQDILYLWEGADAA